MVGTKFGGGTTFRRQGLQNVVWGRKCIPRGGHLPLNLKNIMSGDLMKSSISAVHH